MKPEDTRFMIVGLGLIGGSYARGLTKKGFCVNAIDTQCRQHTLCAGRKDHLPRGHRTGCGTAG